MYPEAMTIASNAEQMWSANTPSVSLSAQESYRAGVFRM